MKTIMAWAFGGVCWAVAIDQGAFEAIKWISWDNIWGDLIRPLQSPVNMGLTIFIITWLLYAIGKGVGSILARKSRRKHS